MSSVKFQLDYSGGMDLLTNNPKLKNIQYSLMESILPAIEAQFFQEFGVEGKFEISDFVTDRYGVKIYAANKLTSTVLAKNPKWLNQFITNLSV